MSDVQNGRMLIIEDADAIRAAVAAGLGAAGHEVLTRPDGAQLERDLAQFRPDVVVLDVMLPGRDGFALLESVRAHCPAGVVMLTARDGVEDRVRGLRAGSDDCVIKPFDLAELVARVEALLRRMGKLQTKITIADLVVDLDSRIMQRGKETVTLTATEFKLLAYLAAHRDQVVTKTQILTAVWGYEDYDPNLVEVYVSAVRRKLEEHGPRLLHTVRGMGYALRAEKGRPIPDFEREQCRSHGCPRSSARRRRLVRPQREGAAHRCVQPTPPGRHRREHPRIPDELREPCHKSVADSFSSASVCSARSVCWAPPRSPGTNCGTVRAPRRWPPDRRSWWCSRCMAATTASTP
jgi:DNA-binding response OmpR family regulator